MQPNPKLFKTIGLIGWTPAYADYVGVLESIECWNIIIKSVHCLHDTTRQALPFRRISLGKALSEVCGDSPDMVVVFCVTKDILNELKQYPAHRPVLFVNPHVSNLDTLRQMAHFLSNPKRATYVHFDKIESSAYKYIQTLIRDNTLGSLYGVFWQEVTHTNTQSLFSYLQEPLLLLKDLLGKVPYCLSEDDAMGGSPANVWLKLKDDKKGHTGTVHISHENPLPNRCILECSEGRIEWPFKDAGKLYIHHNHSPDVAKVELLKDFSQTPFQAHYRSQCSVQELILESIRNILFDRAIGSFTHTALQHQEALNLIESIMSQSRLVHHGWFQVDELARLQKTRPLVVIKHA